MKSYPFCLRAANLLLELRNRHFVALDLCLLLLTPALALLLRSDDFAALAGYTGALALYTAYALALRLASFHYFDFYRRYWRYASIDELGQLIRGMLAATALILALFFLVRWPPLGLCAAAPAACGLPRALPFIDGLLALLGVTGSRLSVRLAAAWLNRQRRDGPTRRVLIMGAGQAGAMIVKELRTNPQLGLEPVGFADDDLHKHDVRIHGIPVLGSRCDIPELVRQHRIAQVIIAMPTAPGKVIREVVRICNQAGVETRTIPGIYEILDGTVSLNQLREVRIEDLLRREPVQTDITAVRELLRGKRVLVTGGGGSIGAELCRQVLRGQPAALAILGHGENSVFEIHEELKGQISRAAAGPAAAQPAASRVIPFIADIRFAEDIGQIFQEFRPQVVFHAAAHKHVPLMEANPAEAITTNVLGTRNLVAAALATGVEHFVMISTDKAVNPTSVMGASKRAAELLIHRAAQESGRAFVAVRFGNVLGSRGSVLLTFKKQIAAGGPVTVTHPEIVRYFMTIPEAVQLVLQAAAQGRSGEVFVLDMGEPVKIADLARSLIELSGLEVNRDIEIVFTGLRPGEKLYEELFIEGERYDRTRHKSIFIAHNGGLPLSQNLDAAIQGLEQAARSRDRAQILQGLKALAPTYQLPEPAAPTPAPEKPTRLAESHAA